QQPPAHLFRLPPPPRSKELIHSIELSLNFRSAQHASVAGLHPAAKSGAGLKPALKSPRISPTILPPRALSSSASCLLPWRNKAMTNQQFSALCILPCTALGSVWELLAAAAAFDAFPRCYGGMGSTLDNLEMLFGMSI